MSKRTLVPIGAETAAGWYAVEVKLWLAKVYAFVGKLDDMSKEVKRRFPDDKDLWELVRACQDNQGTFWAEAASLGGSHLIYLPSFHPFDADDTIALMHESLHVAQKMLHCVGAEVSQERSETLAYTQQYIFAELFRELMKKSKRASVPGMT